MSSNDIELGITQHGQEESRESSSLKSATSEFTSMAELQSVGTSPDENESSGELRSSSTCRVASLILCSLVVFGIVLAVNIFSLYVGIVSYGDACNKPLALWSIVNGVLGLSVTALLMAVSIPKDLERASESERGGFLRERIRPPTFPRSEQVSATTKYLIGFLGLFQFLVLIWFFVGTAWVFQSHKESCPYALYMFDLILIGSLWAFAGLACLVSLVGGLFRESLRRRRASADLRV